MSIPNTYASHADARKAGWFSRRHQTDAAHRSAQDEWRDERQEKASREQRQHAAWLAAKQLRAQRSL